jgi:hypothetical protein
MTDSQNLEEKIQEDLQKTGYPTEIVSASIMQQRGWHVLHNPSYLDDTEYKNREFDIWAVRTLQIEKPFADILSVSVCLITECKKSDKPWVFFTTPEKHGAYILGRVIKWRLEEQQVFTSHSLLKDKSGRQSIITDNQLREFHHYFKSDRLARTFYEPLKGEKFKASPHIYDAIMSVIKATLFHNQDDPKENWLRIYYPVVIFSGNLFEAQVDEKKSIKLTPVEHLQLSFNYKRPSSPVPTIENQSIWNNYHEFIIDVVHEKYLDSFLHLIENEQDILADHLYGSLKSTSFEPPA